jgi:hypothetical protein
VNRPRQRWPVNSYARFKCKPRLLKALEKAGVTKIDGTVSFAELERRMGAMYRGGRGPSRQYLSRLLSDRGRATTTCQTAERLCIVAGVDKAAIFDFVVPNVRNTAAQNGQRRRKDDAA